MKGDFSRDTFDAGRHYAGVLMQQGRVQLDADFNEQGAIARSLLRSFVRDLVGSHGGPAGCLGFRCITGEADLREWFSEGSAASVNHAVADEVDWQRDFLITPGRYYVDGMQVANNMLVRYSDFGAQTMGGPSIANHDSFLVYLEAFERVVTAIEDPRLLEPALGGTDTTTRLQVHWHIHLEPCSVEIAAVRELPLRSRLRYGAMTAQTWSPSADAGERTGYTGDEDRLYRIEIHSGAETGAPSFKWSRNNGANVRAVRPSATEPRIGPLTLELSPATSVVRQPRRIDIDTFVELLPEFDPGPHVQGPVLRVIASASDGNAVTLDTNGTAVDVQHVRLLRCWDQRSSTVPVPDHVARLAIEDGIEVVFDPNSRCDLRAGDYWVIPARTSTADIDWPRVSNSARGCPASVAMPPNGPVSSAAAIGLLRSVGGVWSFEDARRRFGPLAN